MSPEEKAKELVEKFNFICHIDSDGFGDYYETKHNREQCALIAVAEILKETPMYTGNLNPKWVYWNRVMDEIEKL
jgi:hypothetical protein